MQLFASTHSPARAFGAALFDFGLRVREEYDELILSRRDFELRVQVADKSAGSALQCSISVAEHRLSNGSLVLFNEIALEGYPAVAFGAGRGQVTFEFAWFHPTGADWRISAERCQGLIDRVIGSLVPGAGPKVSCQPIAGRTPLRRPSRRGGLAPADSRG